VPLYLCGAVFDHCYYNTLMKLVLFFLQSDAELVAAKPKETLSVRKTTNLQTGSLLRSIAVPSLDKVCAHMITKLISVL